ncbi:MAG: hypothetical protein ACREJB_13985 [Planctomycetaceae bacterium]
MNDLADKLGICQWFHYEDFAAVEQTVELLSDLGVRHLRTGISWADWHRPRGQRWYQWQMRALADFDVLLSVWHTPPSIAEGGRCSGPPRRLRDYADFLWLVIQEYGESFTHLELWNEPNNRLKWDFVHHDPDWSKFSEMIGMAARTAKMCDVPTVLGGMIPVDPQWLELIKRHGALGDDIDIVAIHGFPGMWWEEQPNWDWHSHWKGWDEKVQSIAPQAESRPIWITETGLATWDLATSREAKFDLQVRMLDEAAAAPAERVYWYSLIDLDPSREAIEGFHVDENEYHMGLVRHDGTRKDAWHRLRELLTARGEADA